MKFLILCLIIIFGNVSTQALDNERDRSAPLNGTIIIAERLASKSISEVIEIVLNLQIECQQHNSLDACQGVKSLVDALNYRVANVPNKLSDKTLGFVNGLMEGVMDANRRSISQIDGVKP